MSGSHPEVADWVRRQNELTFAFLHSIPGRQRIIERLTRLWNYERYTAPFKVGGRYYFSKNSGLEDQSVLYTMASLEAEPEVLIDPNTWSKDGTVATRGNVLQQGRSLRGVRGGGCGFRLAPLESHGDRVSASA